MIAILPALIASSHVPPAVAAFEGHDVGVRAVRQGSKVALELFVVEQGGIQTVVAVSSTHTAAKTNDPLLRSLGGLGLDRAEATADGILLKGGSFSCSVHVPASGHVLAIEVTAEPQTAPRHDALFGVALAPNKVPTRATGRFMPPGGQTGIATTERLAMPISLVSGGSFSLALLPDVSDLERNRPMPPVLLLKNDGRVSPAAILAYGFASYDRDAEWAPRLVDRDLSGATQFSWKFDLLVARQDTALDELNRFVWSKYGTQRAMKPLPQVVPFRYYTKPTYALESGGGEEEEEPGAPEKPGLWWTIKSAGSDLRAPKGADGLAKLTTDGNIARFAWGLRWWGDRLRQDSWSEHADEVMNLVCSAPKQDGKTATAFDTEKNAWHFGPRDSTSEAVTARWKLAYAEGFFYARNSRLVEQVEDSARSLMASKIEGPTALFLQAFARSSAVEDSELKKLAGARLAASKQELLDLADECTGSFERPSIETVSLALFLAREADGPSHRAARRLVEALFLYQALWQPVTVSGVELFGAFVGDHLLEEAQSNYTNDLLAASIALDDPVLCARSLAALRSPLALFNHESTGVVGLFLPASIALNRSAAWFGSDGQSGFGAWRGIAEGVGQTLTSAADVLSQFGSCYRAKSGWLLGLDGMEFDGQGAPQSAFSRNPVAFEGTFPYELVDASSGLRTQGSDPTRAPAIRALVLEQDTTGLAVVALPGFTVTDATEKLHGEFVFADGTSTKAEFFPTGLGARVTQQQLSKGPVSFVGSYAGLPLSVPATALLVGPPAPTAQWPMGWRWLNGLSDVTALTAQALDTADDGRGGRNEGLTGVIESQRFLLSRPTIRFALNGRVDKGTRVELVDLSLGVPVLSATMKSDGREEVVWDLARGTGRTYLVRIVDESKRASIRVSDLRQAAAGQN